MSELSIELSEQELAIAGETLSALLAGGAPALAGLDEAGREWLMSIIVQTVSTATPN